MDEMKFKRRDDDTIVIVLSGNWKLGADVPSADRAREEIDSAQVQRLAFDTAELNQWDSSLLTFLIKIKEYGSLKKITVETEGLPEGARRLLSLASAVPERKGARKELKRESFL